MSGAMVFGLFVAGVVLVGTGISWGATRNAPAGVLSLAQGAGVVVPPQLMGGLAERWRRRMSALAWARVVVLAPLCALIAWFVAVRFNAATWVAGIPSPLTGSTVPVAVWGAAVLATASGGGWELARHRRAILAGRAVTEEPTPVRLCHAFPLWLIWGQRLGAALPVAIAVASQVLLRRSGYAQGMEWTWTAHALLLVAGVGGGWALERAQLAVLNGRYSSGFAQELAFDDLLRVRQAITMAPLPAIALYVAESFVLRPVFASVPHGVRNLQDIGTAWALAGVLILWSASRTHRADHFHRYSAAPALVRG